MKRCLSCNNSVELKYNNPFCSNCYLDRLIDEFSIYGIPIYVLVSNTSIKVVIDDPYDLLGRVKPKIVRKILAEYKKEATNVVRCTCGRILKCEQSILVQANGKPHAFCDLDCYETLGGTLYVKRNFNSR